MSKPTRTLRQPGRLTHIQALLFFGLALKGAMAAM